LFSGFFTIIALSIIYSIAGAIIIKDLVKNEEGEMKKEK